MSTMGTLPVRVAGTGLYAPATVLTSAALVTTVAGAYNPVPATRTGSVPIVLTRPA